MKYELYTYSKTDGADSISIAVEKFESEDALFAYVRRYDYILDDGKTRSNYLIEAIMTNPRDSLRRKIPQYKDRKKKEIEKTAIGYGYLIKDEKGRIIDLRNYTDEVYRFDVKKYEKEIRKKDDSESEIYQEKRDYLSEKKPDYKELGSFPEICFGSIKEYRPYIKSKLIPVKKKQCIELPIIFDELLGQESAEVSKYNDDILSIEIEESIANTHKKGSRPKKSTKQSRAEKYKNKLKRIAKYDIYGWYARMREDSDGNEIPIRRYYRSNNASRFSFYKTYSNKKVRRYKDEIKNGNYYRRIFDYWWTIY